MNLAQLLARSARTFPERPAVMVGTRPLHTYAGLAARAARLAGFLRRNLRLEAGDRVAIYMSNCPEYLECLYGMLWAGLVAVPINAKLHPREASYILADAGARLACVSRDLADGLGACLAGEGPELPVLMPGDSLYIYAVSALAIPVQERAPDDLAWLFYTSGTTGKPKGVMLSHRNLLAMTSCFFMDVDPVAEEDVAVYAAPLSHGAGLYSFPYVLRACRHVIPESGRFEPDELIALAGRIGRLAMFAAPNMMKRLVAGVKHAGTDPSGFRTLIYGGGPMYAEDIIEALEVMGPRFVQIYGQGESPMTITALSRAVLADRSEPTWASRIASVGVAQSLVEVRIVDAEGRPLANGEVGEVVVRGETVMSGYWRLPEASAAVLRDGWLWTGDMGTMDSHGFVTLKDRSKDVIISGGSNIYPREVEELLLSHPAVREVSVVGRRDPEWGEVVVAFVVAESDATGLGADELDRYCLERISRFKRPKDYRFVDELPKNNYGKVLKTALRNLLDDAPAL
ncbi:long-chain acyl-CoA synthetase [Azotobacter beijerinckii]|uniref:Long-chain acyl-CoA synthetase n=1 Tax=Azotobacter beijerinckii TaxID=170623 RepID=A0A1H9QEW5_9GAMM|nr:AMP-binding protein [Azotobacter beijerinckii]SER59014.1 long-chain acyl-CoA synthetase [Azotobacter beijerinckii]